MTIGGREKQPSDSSLTTSAGLYLKPIPGSSYEDDRGPNIYIGEAKPSGLLSSFVNDIGPVWGWIDVTENGLRWRPRPRAARWGFQPFEIRWREITGAELSRVVWEGREILFMVQTSSARLELIVTSIMESPLREILGEYLESPKPPSGGRFGLP